MTMITATPALPVRTIAHSIAFYGVVYSHRPLTDQPWGTCEFSVCDRDNNLITFFEPI